MGNTFGGQPLRDPAALLRECLDRDLPTYWHGSVTVANCPPGRDPGIAAFIMNYGELQKLSKATDHTLNFANGEQTIDLKKWTLREASAIISGNINRDDNTPYLVRAVDRRWHLNRSPFSKAYNVTTDGTNYVASTKNGSTAWTWSQMFADLWTFLPGSPTAPTLPFTPHGTPQNFIWFGSSSAWQAINDLLDRLACIICYDPVADSFTVERLGLADAAAVAFENTATKKGQRIWDSLPVAFDRADWPESVKVVFRRYPAPPTGSDTTYAVTTSLSGTGVVSSTIVQIEDDACAIGATGTPTNSAYLAARAAERTADFKRKLQGFDRRLIRSYRGLWKEAVASPGSTYANLLYEDRGAGYATEIKANPDRRIEEWKAHSDKLPQSINASNRLFQLGIAGTPTAGTFTITITNPDATTTNTGNIAYSSEFDTVKSNITTALNAVLGTGYAEVGGDSWATFYVRMGDSLHTLTAVNVGSLTGASGGSVSAMSSGSVQWLLSPEPLKFDNRTGIKVLNDGTATLFPTSLFQAGMVALDHGANTGQTMGDNAKFFPAASPASIVAGRSYGAGDIADGGLDDAYQGSIFCYGNAGGALSGNTLGAIAVISDLSEVDAFSGSTRHGTANETFANIRMQSDNASGTQNSIVFQCLNQMDLSGKASAAVRRVEDATYAGSVIEVGIDGSRNSRFRVTRSDTGDADWPDGAGTYDGVDGVIIDATGGTFSFTGGILRAIASGTPGASGTFTTADTPAKTVTVTNGIITSIV